MPSFDWLRMTLRQAQGERFFSAHGQSFVLPWKDQDRLVEPLVETVSRFIGQSSRFQPLLGLAFGDDAVPGVEHRKHLHLPPGLRLIVIMFAARVPGTTQWDHP